MWTPDEKQRKIWTVAALTAPTAHLAAGIPWNTVLSISLLAAGLRGLLGLIPFRLRKPFSLLLAAAAVQAMEFLSDCWPSQKDMEWVMAILLILAGILAVKGKEEAVSGGILLWWAVAFLFGSILLSSLPEIGKTRLVPGTFRAYEGKALLLLTVLLTPVFQERTGKTGSGLLILLPAAFSVCTQGVLGAAAAEQQAPFYELSRSIRLYGAFDRMEALAWLGLMLGTFLYLSYLLTGVLEQAGKGKKPRWVLGILAVTIIGISSVLPESMERKILAVFAGINLIYGTVRAGREEKRLQKKNEKI